MQIRSAASAGATLNTLWDPAGATGAENSTGWALRSHYIEHIGPQVAPLEFQKITKRESGIVLDHKLRFCNFI